MSIPWIEKYRPQELKDIILDDVNRTIIETIMSESKYPHLLFYGPPGTGKTTTVICFIKKYQEKYNCKKNYIHLNASHERGIDVIRNQISQFINTSTFFEIHRKFVILDEMDSLTIQAQNQLHHLIRSCNKNVTFILICNYINKVIPSLHESLLTLHFNQTSQMCDQFIQRCLENENLHVQKEYIDHLKHLHTHDLRSILNSLQNVEKENEYLILHHDVYESLLHTKSINKLQEKICKIYDPYTVQCGLYHHIIDRYPIYDNLLYTMKELLLSEQDEGHYFWNKFLPSLRIKLKKN